jgi:hypothetical protein
VAGTTGALLHDECSLVQLVLAVLIHVSNKWNKKNFNVFEQQQIRSLRSKLKLDDTKYKIETHSVRLNPQKCRVCRLTQFTGKKDVTDTASAAAVPIPTSSQRILRLSPTNHFPVFLIPLHYLLSPRSLFSICDIPHSLLVCFVYHY